MILIHLQIEEAKENVKLHKIDENVNESVAMSAIFANDNSSYLHRLTTVTVTVGAKNVYTTILKNLYIS